MKIDHYNVFGYLNKHFFHPTFKQNLMCHYFFYLNSDHDTVGAVAIDSAGHLACATSTGGITAKRAGRVGDTPVIGAGGFADDFVGAVSTTGHGETIMRACLSRHITGLMQQGIHISFNIL